MLLCAARGGVVEVWKVVVEAVTAAGRGMLNAVGPFELRTDPPITFFLRSGSSRYIGGFVATQLSMGYTHSLLKAGVGLLLGSCLVVQEHASTRANLSLLFLNPG